MSSKLKRWDEMTDAEQKKRRALLNAAIKEFSGGTKPQKERPDPAIAHAAVSADDREDIIREMLFRLSEALNWLPEERRDELLYEAFGAGAQDASKRLRRYWTMRKAGKTYGYKRPSSQ